MPRLIDIAPDFFQELMRGLESVQPQLVDQIRNASIHHWTYDPSSGADAIYIYVAPHRDLNAAEQNVIGLRHGESIPVEAQGHDCR